MRQNSELTRKSTLETIAKIRPQGAPKGVSTEKLAELLGVKPQTVRRAICVDGDYLGLIPCKLPNGRLLFILE